MNRLYLIEGIPGAGKTTTAKKRKEELEQQGYNVDLYEEGMLHPADCAWQAFLTEEEYKEFLDECYAMWMTSDQVVSWKELKQIIESQVKREGGYVILAYTKIRFQEEKYWALISKVANRELCDGRSSYQEFKRIHLERWNRFSLQAQKSNHITIFECAFLQNHIFELMGIYEKSDEEIYTHLKELIDTVLVLNPMILYLEPDSVEAVITQAAEERKAPISTRKDWIDEIADWVSNSNYGKNRELKGKDGVVQFCRERMRIDKMVLAKLRVPVTYIRRH